MRLFIYRDLKSVFNTKNTIKVTHTVEIFQEGIYIDNST